MCVNQPRSDNPYYVSLTVGQRASCVFLEPDERQRRGGARPMTAAERVARFFTRIKVDDSGCWLWTGARLRTGYGQLFGGRYPNGKTLTLGAHVVMWRLTHDGQPVPEGMEVTHACHVRRCVNPAHLRIATHRENLLERHGQDTYSVPRPAAWTFPRTLVREALNAPRGTVARLAREYGVSAAALAMAVRRERQKPLLHKLERERVA